MGKLIKSLYVKQIKPRIEMVLSRTSSGGLPRFKSVSGLKANGVPATDLYLGIGRFYACDQNILHSCQ